jgi:DNA mismatch endonuclease (patch repair protein)
LADIVDAGTRSRMMSGIRSRDTRPEKVIRSALHQLGFRFRLHGAKVPGRPDLVLPKYRAAVFVHGCFWHGHDCRLYRPPATRAGFWREKISRNRARDLEVRGLVLDSGWRHLTIWECAIRGRGKAMPHGVIERTARWLRGPRKAGEIRGRL